MKRLLYITVSLGVFAALLIYPDEAADGVRNALGLCARLIIPSLFPFFIAANLLNELGASKLPAAVLSPSASKLLGVSGCGAAAFIIGITGGYPLGAAYTAGLRRQGLVSRSEASALIVFCNNSGPAFIIGAVGIGVFGSVRSGIFLYVVHILSALAVGIIFRPKAAGSSLTDGNAFVQRGFSEALTVSVKRSAESIIGVCAFIAAFSVVCAVLGDFIGTISGELSRHSGLSLSWCRALLRGALELGNGIGCMNGLGNAPLDYALAALLLGWGGVSVHFQTFAVLADTDIKTARYIIGRLTVGLISAALALLGASVLL